VAGGAQYKRRQRAIPRQDALPAAIPHSSPVGRQSDLSLTAAAFTGIYVIWGTTYLAVAIAIRTWPPFILGSVRMLLAGGLMYAWLRARRVRPFRGLNIAGTVLCGVLMSGVGNGLMIWAQEGVPSGITALFVASLPMFILLLDWAFFLRSPPPRLAAAGVLLGLAGVAVLSTHSHGLSGRARPIHIIVLLLAELAWAVATLLQRRYAPGRRFVSFTCLQLLAGGLFQLLAAALHGDWVGFTLQQVGAASWFALAYLVLFGSMIASNCYSYLIAHVPAQKVATYALVNPIIALALGGAVLGERVSPAAVTASVLVMGGVALVLLQGVVQRRLG